MRIPRHNAVTGALFTWEQERFDPVTRCIFAYISLRDPASRQVLLPLAGMPVSAYAEHRHVHTGLQEGTEAQMTYFLLCLGGADALWC